jgi:hypothetical protein
MKIVQKLAIIILLFSFSYAENINKQYIDELLDYNIKLPSNIYNSFVVKQTVKPQVKQIKAPKIIEKKLILLAIFNNKALVEITGINEKKWLKVGEKIEKYKLKKIIDNKAILVQKNKKNKIISLVDNNFNIKVRR